MKRKNKSSLIRKIIKTLPVLSIAVLVVYVGVQVKDIELPVLLPVTDVEVSGDLKFLDRKQLESIVKDNVAGGYFTVDLTSIHEKLIQQPWVDDVSLRRKWPASLYVTVSEHEPVAYWNDDGYINESGEVFKPGKIDKDLALPKLSGPDGRHNNVWKFMNVLYQEMALLEYEVVRLDLDERRAWQLVITANERENLQQDLQKDLKQDLKQEASTIDMGLINVKLGRFETEKRLRRFVRILPALTGEDGRLRDLQNEGATGGHEGNGIKVIDMRYPNGFAVQIKEA